MTNEKTEAASRLSLPRAIALAAIIIAGTVYAATRPPLLPAANAPARVTPPKSGDLPIESESASSAILLPVRWGDLGAKIVSVGVIDADKFKAVYDRRGIFTEEYETMLFGQNNGDLAITKDNAGYLLNLFWALGLGTKNPILENGPMADSRYGGAGNFASAGGWTIGEGDAMEHYSRHPFVVLTPDQQTLLERVAKNIYRPCCDNPAHFPDCNHGMAMLGLLELMVSQDVSEQDMYKAALRANAHWFPDAYAAIAQYFASKKIDWSEADPKEILGANYSSASGYRQILSQVAAPAKKPGGACGV